MRDRPRGLALMAYGISAAFVVAGLLALAGGDAHIGPNKVIREPSDMVGSDRHAFGALLLAAGYVFWRWIFRHGEARRLTVELQIVALFAAAGYVAYHIGG